MLLPRSDKEKTFVFISIKTFFSSFHTSFLPPLGCCYLWVHVPMGTVSYGALPIGTTSYRCCHLEVTKKKNFRFHFNQNFFFLFPYFFSANFGYFYQRELVPMGTVTYGALPKGAAFYRCCYLEKTKKKLSFSF